MDPSFPDWKFDEDFPILDQINSTGPDPEIVELLWRNGELVFNRQTQKNPVLNYDEGLQYAGQDQAEAKTDSECKFVEEEETVSWFQHPFEEYSLSSSLFSEIPRPDPSEPRNSSKCSEDERLKIPKPQQRDGNRMPPPPNLKSSEEATNGSREPPVSTTIVGPSHCTSSRCTYNDSNNFYASTAPTNIELFANDDGRREMLACNTSKATQPPNPNASSSSGGSACSKDRASKETSVGNGSNKRKSFEPQEYSESQSEAMEKNSSQRSGSSRRSRTAEVHNLSERRRRDRINAKMKALQELIPHCNRTDKVSILDEAIEYLKSLQIQLQMMWMGSGMAHMAFAGVQSYMPRMNMAMASTGMMPPAPNYSMRDPQNHPGLINHAPMLNQLQMQNQALSEHFSQYMGGLQHAQTAAAVAAATKFQANMPGSSRQANQQSSGTIEIPPSFSIDNAALSSRKKA